MKRKFLCYSDTHFNFTFPWTKYNFVERIADEQPAGLFLHGDISCGLTIGSILGFLASQLEGVEIYFVIGNHDHYGISMAESAKIIRRVCEQYSNLTWLTDRNIVALNDKAALIGEDGWYDSRLGNPVYLAYNLDWIMIEEFRKLKSFDERLAFSQELADTYTATLKIKLEQALQNFQTVYIMTHVPPWREAVRGAGTMLEEFWLPYNINSSMGQMIEEVMHDRDNQNVVVLSGHTHNPAIIKVSHNIECVVQNGKYLGPPTDHNCVFI